MIPGLDGKIHQDTLKALLIAFVGGLLAGGSLSAFGTVAFVAFGVTGAYLSLLFAPDAETVTSDWIDYQREQAEEGSA